MTNHNSVFTNILNDNSRSFLHEDEHFFAILDAFPVSPGHSLIITKRPVISVLEMNKNEWAGLGVALNNLTHSLREMDFNRHYREMIDHAPNEHSVSFLTDALESPYLESPIIDFNFGINEGAIAGRSIDHVHWHLIPRFEGDHDQPRGGMRNIFPELGDYTPDEDPAC